MKKVSINLYLDNSEVESILEEYKKENPKRLNLDVDILIEAIASDFQKFAYDIGQMHGSFEINNIKDL